MKNEGSSLKLQELAYGCKIGEAMTDELTTVSPDDTMMDVRKVLEEKRISGLPVVDNERLIGLISTESFIKSIINGSMEKSVKDDMTSDVETIYSDEPLIHAIRKFESLGYGRFPVLERGTKKLVGIITKGDIVKCLLKKLEKNYYRKEQIEYSASHLFEDIVSDDTKISFRYEIHGGNYKSAGEQSGYLKENLLKIGIHPDITRRVTIASCEAEMNIVIFTEAGELIVEVEKDKIRVNAVDRGPGIPNIEEAMRPGFSTAPDWVREMGFGAGMGLPNIKKCADELEIKSKVGEGTNLEFVVNT